MGLGDGLQMWENEDADVRNEHYKVKCLDNGGVVEHESITKEAIIWNGVG